VAHARHRAAHPAASRFDGLRQNPTLKQALADFSSRNKSRLKAPANSIPNE
jgi:hypothetical protein